MSKQSENSDIATSPNPAELKKRELMQLLPEAFSEGRLDTEALKRALGEEFVCESGERYRLDWAGKSEAYKVLQAPTTAALRPQRDKSVNFDTARHVFIEGENLETLKVLQKAYFGKVKLIYIDPPYNTGNDHFVYPDRFQENKEEYLKRLNELDDDGSLMREGFFRKNSRESGHYHSNWLSMMLPRLYIARNLLREDGVIFVSIDDNEVHNLRCLMNEVFGEENFVAQLIWKARKFTDTRALTNVSTDHEYVLCYSRQSEFSFHGLQRDESKFTNPDNDPRGPWMSRSMLGLASREQRPNLYYIIADPKTGWEFPPPEDRGWRYSKERMSKMIEEERVLFPTKKQGRPREKKFRSEMTSERIAFPSIIVDVHTADGTSELRKRLGKQVFDFPKPVELIKRIVKQGASSDGLILDFFAGSGTTMEAVLQLNLEDGGDRKCILVQMPELLAADNGEFHDIAQVARSRIRGVLKDLEQSEDLINKMSEGEGFKAFALTPSSFKQWRGEDIESGEALAEQVKLFKHSEKEGAEIEAMLYELLLKFGFELTEPVSATEIGGCKAYSANQGKVLFFLKELNAEAIDDVLEAKPRQVIALDSVFSDSDELKTNFALQCRDADIRFTCL